VLDEELLQILACPVCVAPLRQEAERLICARCGRRYPIRQGIPVLLVDEAELPAAGGEGRTASQS
jgi:uncharacterized protein